MFEERMNAFDHAHADALRGIWFLGDVHGEFKYLAQALLKADTPPNWLVFLGDIDIFHKPFREILEPLRRNFPSTKVGFIHGNHDADAHENWEMLHDCGDAIVLHGKVTSLDGIRVAGLGGNFIGRVWAPPANPTHKSKQEVFDHPRYQWKNRVRIVQPASFWHSAIYPDDLEALAALDADILITHEAPSLHPYGWEMLDELARSLGVVRAFHGHHHDDLSDKYALKREEVGFDLRGVAFCGIKNGLGEVIRLGEVSERSYNDVGDDW